MSISAIMEITEGAINYFSPNENNKLFSFDEKMDEVFQKGFNNLESMFYKTKKNLNTLVESSKPQLELAGLADNTGQQSLKFAVLEDVWEKFQNSKTKDLFDKVLEVLSIIMGSLGNAIPEIGSYISEFIDFVRFLMGQNKV